MNKRSGRFFITYFFTSLFILLLLFPALPRSASGKEAVDPYCLWHLFTGSARTGAESLSAVAVDAEGNTFIAASGLKWYTGQESDFGQPLHSHSGGAEDNRDILVVKFGPDGEFKWYTYYGGHEYDSVRGMAIADGRLYITGTSRDNWGGPNNESSVNQHSRAIWYYVRDGVGGGYGHSYQYVSGDIYVLALNAESGDYLWHTFHGESKWNEEVYGIAADEERVFLVGKADAEFFGCWPKLSGSETDQYVVEDDMERVERLCRPTRAHQGGNDAWVMTLRASDGGRVKHTFLGSKASDDWGEAIAIDKDGFPVVAGSSSKGWNYDNHVHYNASPRNSHSGGFDMFVARLARSDLEYHWHSFFGGTDDDWATAVMVDDNNKYFLTGYSQSNWPVRDISPVAEHTVPVPDYDFVVMKMNNEGDYKWHTFRGGKSTEDVPHAMVLSGDGATLYVVGEVRGPWKKYGDGDPLHGFSGTVGITDMAILGLDVTTGKSKWHTFWGGLGADRAYSVATDPTTGDIVVGGTSDVSWKGDDNEEPIYTFPHADGGLNPNFSVLKLSNYKFVIDASVSGGNGSITPAGKALVKPGADQRFTFTPGARYGVTQVILDGMVQDWSGTNYTISKVADDHTLKVVFKKTYYTITVSADTGGRISPPGDQIVGFRADRQFTVKANGGYVIDTLTVVKGTTTETITKAADKASYTYTFANVQADGKITATFKTKAYTIEVKAGTGGAIDPAGDQIVGRGNSKGFTVTANEGYVIDTLTVVKGTTTETITKAADKASYTYTFENVAANGSITATFKAKAYTVTGSAGTGGTISPAGDQIVGRGKSPRFTVTADAGYRIDTLKVTKGGTEETVKLASDQASYTYLFANVAADGSIKATFKRVHIITGTGGDGGSIEPSGDQIVESGKNIKFTITAHTRHDYVIEALMVDGKTVPAASGQSAYSYEFTNVTQNHRISATFIDPSQVTIRTGLGSGGTISPREDKRVSKGGSLSYIITANEGYVISRVRVIKGTTSETITAASGKASYTHTYGNVQANGSIIATFRAVAKTHTITGSAGQGGSISPTKTTVEEGNSVEFKFTPDSGYAVESVTDNGVTTTWAETTYTITNVTRNHTVSVAFKAKTYTITPTAATTGGSINPGTMQTVAQGGSKDFTVTADAGYLIDTLTVTRGTTSETMTAASGKASYTHTYGNVQANGSIIATFTTSKFYTITGSAGYGGSINPRKAIVKEGQSVIFDFSPDDGVLEVDTITLDNGPAQPWTSRTYTMENVTGNHSIHVTFK